MLLWTYTAIMRPMIIYEPGAILAIALSNISKVQILTCASITGAMTTCPTVVIEEVLNLTPLHTLAESTTRKVVGEGLARNMPQSPKGEKIAPRHAPRRLAKRVQLCKKIYYKP